MSAKGEDRNKRGKNAAARLVLKLCCVRANTQVLCYAVEGDGVIVPALRSSRIRSGHRNCAIYNDPKESVLIGASMLNTRDICEQQHLVASVDYVECGSDCTAR